MADNRRSTFLGIRPAGVIAVSLAGCGTKPPAEPLANDPATKQQVETSLKRLNQLLSARDMKIVDEFAADPDVLFLGSDATEFAVGREQLTRHFESILKQPFTISFDWKDTRSSSRGDVAWIYASGDAVLKGADGEMRSPYRMTGVLERRDGQWKWRQVHGSQPAANPQ